MKDMVGLNDDYHTVLVNVHTVEQCAGQPCCIHNPSNHYMATWAPHWNAALRTMWRRCPDGNLHPDPDDLNFWRSVSFNTARAVFGHFCDGCCQPHSATPVKEIESPQPDWQEVKHKPVWRDTRLPYNAAGDTRPGFECIHELENGMGQCGANVFNLKDADGTHSCIVNKGQP